MLYDKVGEVRVACLNVLEPLYSDPDTAPHLELFTEKFKVSNCSVLSAFWKGPTLYTKHIPLILSSGELMLYFMYSFKDSPLIVLH